MNGCAAADESSKWFTKIRFQNQKNRVLRKMAMVPLDSNSTVVDFILQRIEMTEDKLSKEGNYSSDDITEIMCCKNGKGSVEDEYSIFEMKDYPIKQFMSSNECLHSLLTVTLSSLAESKSVSQINLNDFLMANASKLKFLSLSTSFRFPFLADNNVDKEDNENSLIEILGSNIQQQTKEFLRVLLFQLGIGFTDATESRKLETFVNSYSNVLCFIYNHWARILRMNFPDFPGKNLSSPSMALRLLTFVDASKR